MSTRISPRGRPRTLFLLGEGFLQVTLADELILVDEEFAQTGQGVVGGRRRGHETGRHAGGLAHAEQSREHSQDSAEGHQTAGRDLRPIPGRPGMHAGRPRHHPESPTQRPPSPSQSNRSLAGRWALHYSAGPAPLARYYLLPRPPPPRHAGPASSMRRSRARTFFPYFLPEMEEGDGHGFGEGGERGGGDSCASLRRSPPYKGGGRRGREGS